MSTSIGLSKTLTFAASKSKSANLLVNSSRVSLIFLENAEKSIFFLLSATLQHEGNVQHHSFEMEA